MVKSILPKDGSQALVRGAVVSEALYVMVSPLLSRLYRPDEFGLLAVLLAYASLLAVVGAGRYHLAIPVVASEDEALGLASLSSMLVLLMGGLIIAGGLIADGMGHDVRIYPLTAVAAVSAAFLQTSEAYALRHAQFATLGQSRILERLVQIMAQLTGGLMGLGHLGLIWGQIVREVVGTGYIVSRSVHSRWTMMRVSGLWQLAVRYRRFPMWSTPAALLNTAATHLVPLGLVSIYGPHAAGLYLLSQRVVSAPMSWIGKAFTQVYWAQAAQSVRCIRDIEPLFYRTAAKLLVWGLVPLLPVGMVGPGLFSWVFGDQWLQAGQYARALVPMALTEFVAVPLSQTLLVFQRQELSTLWNLVRLLFVLVSLGSAWLFGLPELAAIVLYSTTMSIAYSFLLVICMSVIRAGLRQDRGR